ncbi:MAG: hypothetical protein V3G42_15070, partial [Oscillospiraceae bacterium]
YMANLPAEVSNYKSVTIKFEDYNIKPYRVRLVHETELGISNMNMTLRMTPVTESGSAFKLNKALRTLYEENSDGTLNTTGTAYGNYGAEIDGYTLAIDNYAGYRPRVKNADGTYVSEDLIYIDNNGNSNNPNHYKYDWRQNHSEYRGYRNSSFAVPYQKTDDNGLPEAFPDGEGGEIKLYETDFGENTTHQNTRLIRGRAEVTTLDKNAGAEKYAQAVNDVDRSCVNITYTLSGYEGYLIDSQFSDQIIQNVSNLERAANQGIDNQGNAIKIASPKREYVYFYDLLPPGVEYDASVTPVVARTKVPTVYDANQQKGYDPDVFVNSYWDTSAAEIVSLDEEHTAIVASITTNWNGSSRTLIKFKVKVSDEDTSYTYDPISKEWFFGCGIRFGTYVKWENYGLARLSDNLFCYVGSTESDNGEIYSDDLIGRRGTQIYMDDPDSSASGAFLTGTEASYYSYFKKNTDAEKDFDSDDKTEEYNRAYARKNNLPVMPNASQGHISKTVRADENKTAEFVTETAVTTGGGYTYRISLDTFAPNALGDIVIYDELEKTTKDTDDNTKTEYWQGKFESVDVSALRDYLLLLGVRQNDINNNLKIYYTHSASPKEPVNYETGNDENGNDTLKCTGVLNFTVDENTTWIQATADGKIDEVNDVNKNDRVTAIVVVYKGKLMTANNQAVTQLKTSIDIKMTAPATIAAANSKYPYAKNTSWYSVNEYEVTGGEDKITHVSDGPSTSTVVTIGEKMKLIVTKTLGDSVPDELKDEVFNFHINAYVGKANGNGIPDVVEQPFANIPYELYQKKYIPATAYESLSPEDKSNYTQEGTEYYCWENIEKTIPHTTDSNGGLSLKDKQKAEFTYISLVDYEKFNIATTGELVKREIDAYNIEEEIKPYWYATKEVKTQTGQTSPEGFSYSECSVEFRNDFRPVIYLSKTVGYIPESMKNADQTFDFIFRIKDSSGNYLTVNDLQTGGTHEIKNKEFLSSTENNKDVDESELHNVYENGVFYLYNTASAAGKYSSPKRWYPWLTERGLYTYDAEKAIQADYSYRDGSKLKPYTLSQLEKDDNLKKYVEHLTHGELGTAPDDTAYFVMSIKGGETVGIPVYLGNGMLDEDKKPKYSFEILESSAEYYKETLNDNTITKNAWGDITSNWILTNVTNINAVYDSAKVSENEASGKLSEEIALKYENTGRFKEINLTKNVEFPDEELLKETAFRFRITRGISDSTPISGDSNKLWSDGKTIHWRLVDADGNTVINKVMKTVDGKEEIDYDRTYSY